MKGYYLMPHPPIMIPEVGRGEENKIEKTVSACKKIGKEINSKDVSTIIIISPHGIIFRDGIGIVTESFLEGDLSKFRAPEVKMNMEINKELTDLIIKKAHELDIGTASLDKHTVKSYRMELEIDHGAMVPLYYISKEKQYKLVHIAYGLLSPLELYKFGMAIKEAVNELSENAVLIASGDLSHRLKLSGPYSYSPYGKEFDHKLINILEEGDFSKLFTLDSKLIKEAGECGLRSIYILAGAMDNFNVKGNVLSYEGPFGVGYGVVKFDFQEGNSIYKDIINKRKAEHKRRMQEGSICTRLARKSLEYYYENEKYLEALSDLPKKLTEDKKGVFVSLKKDGDLRGCIGTILPVTSCVAEEIIKNAVSAAKGDPRFPDVRKCELLEIDISVDVLYEPEKATKEDLDPKKYGVIVSKGARKGLLLPNLEGVDTVDAQLEIALQKGGIEPSEDYEIQRFKVERFKEVEDNE